MPDEQLNPWSQVARPLTFSELVHMHEGAQQMDPEHWSQTSLPQFSQAMAEHTGRPELFSAGMEDSRLKRVGMFFDKFMRPEPGTFLYGPAVRAGQKLESWWMENTAGQRPQEGTQQAGPELILGLPRALTELALLKRPTTALATRAPMATAAPGLSNLLSPGAGALAGYGKLGLGGLMTYSGSYEKTGSHLQAAIQTGSMGLFGPMEAAAQKATSSVLSRVPWFTTKETVNLGGVSVPMKLASPNPWAQMATRAIETGAANAAGMLNMELASQASSLATGQGFQPWDAAHAFQIVGANLPFMLLSAPGVVKGPSKIVGPAGERVANWPSGLAKTMAEATVSDVDRAYQANVEAALTSALETQWRGQPRPALPTSMEVGGDMVPTSVARPYSRLLSMFSFRPSYRREELMTMIKSDKSWENGQEALDTLEHSGKVTKQTINGEVVYSVPTETGLLNYHPVNFVAETLKAYGVKPRIVEVGKTGDAASPVTAAPVPKPTTPSPNATTGGSPNGVLYQLADGKVVWKTAHGSWYEMGSATAKDVKINGEVDVTGAREVGRAVNREKASRLAEAARQAKEVLSASTKQSPVGVVGGEPTGSTAQVAEGKTGEPEPTSAAQVGEKATTEAPVGGLAKESVAPQPADVRAKREQSSTPDDLDDSLGLDEGLPDGDPDTQHINEDRGGLSTAKELDERTEGEFVEEESNYVEAKPGFEVYTDRRMEGGKLVVTIWTRRLPEGPTTKGGMWKTTIVEVPTVPKKHVQRQLLTKKGKERVTSTKTETGEKVTIPAPFKLPEGPFQALLSGEKRPPRTGERAPLKAAPRVSYERTETTPGKPLTGEQQNAPEKPTTGLEPITSPSAEEQSLWDYFAPVEKSKKDAPYLITGTGEQESIIIRQVDEQARKIFVYRVNIKPHGPENTMFGKPAHVLELVDEVDVPSAPPVHGEVSARKVAPETVAQALENAAEARKLAKVAYRVQNMSENWAAVLGKPDTYLVDADGKPTGWEYVIRGHEDVMQARRLQEQFEPSYLYTDADTGQQVGLLEALTRLHYDIDKKLLQAADLHARWKSLVGQNPLWASEYHRQLRSIMEQVHRSEVEAAALGTYADLTLGEARMVPGIDTMVKTGEGVTRRAARFLAMGLLHPETVRHDTWWTKAQEDAWHQQYLAERESLEIQQNARRAKGLIKGAMKPVEEQFPYLSPAYSDYLVGSMPTSFESPEAFEAWIDQNLPAGMYPRIRWKESVDPTDDSMVKWVSLALKAEGRRSWADAHLPQALGLSVSDLDSPKGVDLLTRLASDMAINHPFNLSRMVSAALKGREGEADFARLQNASAIGRLVRLVMRASYLDSLDSATRSMVVKDYEAGPRGQTASTQTLIEDVLNLREANKEVARIQQTEPMSKRAAWERYILNHPEVDTAETLLRFQANDLLSERRLAARAIHLRAQGYGPADIFRRIYNSTMTNLMDAVREMQKLKDSKRFAQEAESYEVAAAYAKNVNVAAESLDVLAQHPSREVREIGVMLENAIGSTFDRIENSPYVKRELDITGRIGRWQTYEWVDPETKQAIKTGRSAPGPGDQTREVTEPRNGRPTLLRQKFEARPNTTDPYSAMMETLAKLSQGIAENRDRIREHLADLYEKAHPGSKDRTVEMTLQQLMNGVIIKNLITSARQSAKEIRASRVHGQDFVSLEGVAKEGTEEAWTRVLADELIEVKTESEMEDVEGVIAEKVLDELVASGESLDELSAKNASRTAERQFWRTQWPGPLHPADLETELQKLDKGQAARLVELSRLGKHIATSVVALGDYRTDQQYVLEGKEVKTSLASATGTGGKQHEKTVVVPEGQLPVPENAKVDIGRAVKSDLIPGIARRLNLCLRLLHEGAVFVDVQPPTRSFPYPRFVCELSNSHKARVEAEVGKLWPLTPKGEAAMPEFYRFLRTDFANLVLAIRATQNADAFLGRPNKLSAEQKTFIERNFKGRDLKKELPGAWRHLAETQEQPLGYTGADVQPIKVSEADALRMGPVSRPFSTQLGAYAFFQHLYARRGWDPIAASRMAGIALRMANAFGSVSEYRVAETLDPASLGVSLHNGPGGWVLVNPDEIAKRFPRAEVAQFVTAQVLGHELWHSLYSMYQNARELLPESIALGVASFEGHASQLTALERGSTIKRLIQFVVPKGFENDTIAWAEHRSQQAMSAGIPSLEASGQGTREFMADYASLWTLGMFGSRGKSLEGLNELRVSPQYETDFAKGMFLWTKELVDGQLALLRGKGMTEEKLYTRLSQMNKVLDHTLTTIQQDQERAVAEVSRLISNLSPIGATEAGFNVRVATDESRFRAPMPSTIREQSSVWDAFKDTSKALAKMVETSPERLRDLGPHLGVVEKYFLLPSIIAARYPQVAPLVALGQSHLRLSNELTEKALSGFFVTRDRDSGEVQIDMDASGIQVIGRSEKALAAFNKVSQLKNLQRMVIDRLAPGTLDAALSGLSASERHAVVECHKRAEVAMHVMQDAIVNMKRDSIRNFALRAIMSKLPMKVKVAEAVVDTILGPVLEANSPDPMMSVAGRTKVEQALVTATTKDPALVQVLGPLTDSMTRLAKGWWELNQIKGNDWNMPFVRRGRYQVMYKLGGRNGRTAWDTYEEAAKDAQRAKSQGATNVHMEDITTRPSPPQAGSDVFSAAVLSFENALYSEALSKLGLNPEQIKSLMETYSPLVVSMEKAKARGIGEYLAHKRMAPGYETVDTFEGLFHYVRQMSSGLVKRHVRERAAVELLDPEVQAAPELMTLMDHYIQTVTNPGAKEFTNLKNINFVMWLGGNFSSTVVELATQTPMVLAPWAVNELTQAGKGGFFEAYKTIGRSVAQLVERGSGQFKDRQVADMFKRAEREGLFGMGSLQELAMTEDVLTTKMHDIIHGRDVFSTPRRALHSAWYTVLGLARKSYGWAPHLNAQVGFLTALEVGKKIGLKGDELYSYAEQAVRRTQFSGGTAQRPIELMHNLGKAQGLVGLALSLQTFTLGAIGTWLSYGRQMLKDNLPIEQRVAGAKAFGTMTTSMLAFSGILGLPMASAIIALLDKEFPDLELKRKLSRTWPRGIANAITKAVVGDPELGGPIADVAMDGLINKMGVDIAARTQLSSILGINPYEGFKAGNLIGPIGGVVQKVLGQVPAALASGDIGKAVELGAPSALRNVMRLWSDGGQFRDMEGKMLYEAPMWHKAMYAFGFRPTELSQKREEQTFLRQAEQAASHEQMAFHKQMAAKLVRGEVLDVREGLMNREEERPGEYSAYEGARQVAELAYDMQVPYDITRTGRRAAAPARQALIAQYGKPAPGELARLEGITDLAQTLGVRVRPTGREIARAQMIDQLMTMNPTLDRQSAARVIDASMTHKQQELR